MKPTQTDLDDFNDFVRDVHKFQSRLAAEVLEPVSSLELTGKDLIKTFDKFIKKLEAS